MDKEIKIGLLIPKSQQYQGIDKDFIRGLKLNNLNVKFFVENIGIGASEKIIIEKMQKLIFQEDINIIIGLFGHHNISEVYSYASKNDVLLLISDLGATVPYETKIHKGVYINSFGLNESCYFLGSYLKGKKIQKITTASSFYDAGYGLLSAMEYAFKEDNSFAGHYITPFYPRENEAEQMEYTINTQQPEAVFAFYSGLYAEENADFLSQNKIFTKYPFYVTPFFINDKILENYKNDPHELYIVSSWMQNETDSSEFDSVYNDFYSESPSAFSILGYENGLILKNVLSNTSSLNINSLIEEISKLNISGPRGNIQFDTETNRTLFNHYIYELNLDSPDNISFKKIETLVNDGHFIKASTSTARPDKIGGWQNAYLCH